MSKPITSPIIACQTGFDEAFLIGTREELLDFANAIIEAVDKVQPDICFGVTVKTSNLLAEKLDVKSEVRLDYLVVTETPEEKEVIFQKVTGV
ncbi:hypothetical protein [Pectobacterium sp. B1J-3]|uniref:hypothetical protein n=1 Tax=Pectobacterium sp. B1J-3 TaxID=3385371 RepID=UPI0039062A6D